MANQYTLRIKGLDDFTVSEGAYRQIEDDLLQRRDRMVQVGDYTFNARNFISSRKRWIAEVPQHYQQQIEEISDEQRQRNVRRMRWIRAYMFGKRGAIATLPEEEHEGYQKFVDWYESPEQVEKRSLRKQFKQEFYDVLFADNTELNYCFQSWLPFHDGSRDPRGYKREDHTPEALGLREENSLLKQAEALFGVSA